MTYLNLEHDLLDEFFIGHDEDLHAVLGDLDQSELGPASGAGYTHINGLAETIRDTTGSLPSAAHIRAYVAISSDLSNPTVASAVENLLVAMKLAPPSDQTEQE